MSDTVLLWILGGQAGMVVLILKLWWDHVRECRDRAAEIATIKSELHRVIQDIGDHKTGLRGAVHELRDMFSGPYTKLLMDLERAEKERK